MNNRLPIEQDFEALCMKPPIVSAKKAFLYDFMILQANLAKRLPLNLQTFIYSSLQKLRENYAYSYHMSHRETIHMYYCAPFSFAVKTLQSYYITSCIILFRRHFCFLLLKYIWIYLHISNTAFQRFKEFLLYFITPLLKWYTACYHLIKIHHVYNIIINS